MGTNGFGHHPFARVEGTISFGGRGHSQIAYTHINPCDTGMRFWCWLCCLDLQTDEQVEVLPGFVVPEFGSPDMSALLDQGHMLAIARIGHKHPASQGQNAHLGIWLQAIVPMIVLGQGGGTRTSEPDPTLCSVSWSCLLCAEMHSV